jgi:hypothetical protein
MNAYACWLAFRRCLAVLFWGILVVFLSAQPKALTLIPKACPSIQDAVKTLAAGKAIADTLAINSRMVVVQFPRSQVGGRAGVGLLLKPDCTLEIWNLKRAELLDIYARYGGDA